MRYNQKEQAAGAQRDRWGLHRAGKGFVCRDRWDMGDSLK
jgi:hypothetical protein